MAYSKKEEFSADEIRLAEVAKALSHPARIAILKILASRKSCICGDIVEELPLSQSTVSQHLKELKLAGLIKGDIDGPRVCYCIDFTIWKDAETKIGQLFGLCQDGSCSC
jgi:ArsR family transcriptional regulator, arsenate/arsenite/antimonite-responsive transcriptional repressor